MKGMKQDSLYDVIFQSSSKQFHSNILQPNNNRNFYTSSHLHFQAIKFKFLVNFSKFWNIYLFLWRHYLQIGWKEPRYVFHVPMLIERWKSTIKKIYAEVFLFETTISKFWSVDSPWWHHQPKNVSYKIFLVTIFLSLFSPLHPSCRVCIQMVEAYS